MSSNGFGSMSSKGINLLSKWKLIVVGDPQVHSSFGDFGDVRDVRGKKFKENCLNN